jgi:hypothetical protein
MIDQFKLLEVVETQETSPETMGSNSDRDDNQDTTAPAEGQAEGQEEGQAEGQAEGEEVLGRLRTYTWPKYTYQKMSASVAEDKFDAEGFKAEVQRYFTQQDSDDINTDPLIYVANSIAVRYPSWLQSEEAVDGESDKRPPTEHFMPGDKKMISDRINANKIRHKSVQVYSEKVSNIFETYCHECVRACCPSNVAACPP